MKGAADGPYAGGVYMGKLKFPPEYPWKPPSVLMCTPSGRFDTGKRICLSIRYVSSTLSLSNSNQAAHVYFTHAYLPLPPRPTVTSTRKHGVLVGRWPPSWWA